MFLFVIKTINCKIAKIATHIETRRNILKDKKHCFVRLKKWHISKNCLSKIKYY